MGKKTYKNISTVEQLGIDPGQTGEADIPKGQEERMVERGAIEVVGEGKAPEEAPPEETPEDKAKAEADAKAAEEARRAGGRK